AGARHSEESLLVAQLSVALALRTCGRRASRRCAGAVTRFTRFESGHVNRGLDAFGRFLEADLQVVPQIGSTLRPSAPPASAEDVAEAEHVAQPAEDVAEVGEDRRVESGAAGLRRHSRMAETIVTAALVCIGED